MNTLLKHENNVVALNNDTITRYYDAFLSKYTSGTAKAYKTAVNLMTNFFFEVDAKYVTFEQLKSLKMVDIMLLYAWLREEVVGSDGSKTPRYKINTVNKHIKGMKSFFKFMNNEFVEISDRIFNNIDLENPEKDAEGYGGLEWSEARSLWEYANNEEIFGSKAKKMSALIMLASVTSIRAEALLTSTWSKNWKVKTERGVKVNYIDVVDKSKRHIKPVSEELYNELRQSVPEDTMFYGLDKNNINPLLEKCLEGVGIDKSRNIKFHSLKKAGVMRAFEKYDSIHKAQKQGNHSSPATTEKHYMEFKESLMDMASYELEKDIDVMDELINYSKEDLLKAISKMKDVSKKELLDILKG